MMPSSIPKSLLGRIFAGLSGLFDVPAVAAQRPGSRQRRNRFGATGKQVVNPAGTKLIRKARAGTLTKCHCNKYGN